jgi:Bacterial Ig-like domain
VVYNFHKETGGILMFKNKFSHFLLATALIFGVLAPVTNASEMRPATFGVQKTSPSFSEWNVPVDQTIQITFSRDIELGNGKITLNDGFGKSINHSVNVKGNVLEIVPVEPLKVQSNYSVLIEKEAIQNAEGDTNLLMNDKYLFNFRTVDQAPQVNTATGTLQPITLQLAPETALQPAQSHTVKQNVPTSYKLNATNGNYKLWTANPQLVALEVEGDTLIIKGLSAGTTQVAVKNLLNNTKVVLNVVVQ